MTCPRTILNGDWLQNSQIFFGVVKIAYPTPRPVIGQWVAETRAILRRNMHHARHHHHSYARRTHEKSALNQVFHRYMPTFERMWSDTESGNCLPKHVTEELRKYLTCGILSNGFTQMHCDAFHKRYLVAFSCKGRGFCPSFLGRRMNEGAANLVDALLGSIGFEWQVAEVDRSEYRRG
jgi:hypothetical protein